MAQNPKEARRPLLSGEGGCCVRNQNLAGWGGCPSRREDGRRGGQLVTCRRIDQVKWETMRIYTDINK